MSLSNITSSYLNILTDQIIPYHLLKFCLNSYRSEYHNEDDPFISPLYMKDEIIKLLPPVRILIGSSDPLRNDSLLFLNRMTKLNKDIKVIELKYFPHGFLNYDYSLLMPEAAIANKIMAEEIEKFL